MTSESESANGLTAGDYLARPEYAKVAEAVQRRTAMVTAMQRHAEAHGLLCDEAFVSRHYEWFYRWHTGHIATGYLMHRTGVKRRAVNTPKGKWV